MVILVDYDNVIDANKRLGLALLVERVVARIAGSGIALGSSAHVRLYGGWYESDKLTRRGQSLAAEIQREFPNVVHPPPGRGIRLTCELALSLDVDPRTHFHHTFRKQSSPTDVRCRDPRALGCANAACPAAHVHQVLGSGVCTSAGCHRTIEDLLFRSSQKLVDTMLTVDLLSVANRIPEPVAVVSSDDDLWPGLYHVLSTGHAAIQVHTRPGGIARHPYARTGQAGYFAVELA